MKFLAEIAKEIFGLFVEDGSLALALLAWVGIALLWSRTHSDPRLGGPIFVGGCLLMLLENVRRTARRKQR